MPIFRPRIAAGMDKLKLSGLDLDENARWNDEPVQGFDGAGVWFSDVDDPLVRADFKLLTRLLVDERAAIDGVDFATRGKRNRTSHASASALCVINDFLGRRIKGLMVVGFHANSNLAASHRVT